MYGFVFSIVVFLLYFFLISIQSFKNSERIRGKREKR